MLIRLIRHGMTRGNLEKRYIGAGTDEGLCPEGEEQLRGEAPLTADFWIVSPMKRCLETAVILNGGRTPDPMVLASDLRECDFGRFEGKTYRELSGDRDYERWIESNGRLPFPGGESREEFTDRTCRAFENALRRLLKNTSENKILTANFVVHGGSVMAIAERFGVREDGRMWEYYDAQLSNGSYLYGTVDGRWEREKKIVLKSCQQAGGCR